MTALFIEGKVVDYNTTKGLITMRAVVGIDGQAPAPHNITVSVRPAMAKDPVRYAAVLSSVHPETAIAVIGTAEQTLSIHATHVEVLS